MLKKADEKDLRDILAFCEGDLTGTRIGCYCLSYGFQRDFFDCWVSSSHGEINAVIAKFYDSITLKASSPEDAEEIRQFCEMLCYDEIMCSESCCKAVGFIPTETKKAYVFRGNAGDYTSENLDEAYYKQLYTLISEAIPGSFKASSEAYLSWLSDFTFRKRRQKARCFGVTQNGELLSCVITSSETDKAALLSGVACKSTSRKTGLGKKTVLSAVRALESEGKDVYVIALNESAEGFYEHMGFEYSESIHFIKG